MILLVPTLMKTGRPLMTLRNCRTLRKPGETLSEIWSKTTIDDYEISVRWVDLSDDSMAYHVFKCSIIGKNWLETHVYILKYCLQIAKCDNMECCQPMRSNVQDVLCGKLLLAPLALSGGPYLIDPCKGWNTKDLRFSSESCITAPTT